MQKKSDRWQQLAQRKPSRSIDIFMKLELKYQYLDLHMLKSMNFKLHCVFQCEGE